MESGDLMRLPAPLPAEELVETLAAGRGWRVERIVSSGQATPPGAWCDQPWDEWVALLAGEAELRWDDGRVQRLAAGSWVWIPAHRRHRVERTSADPPCVWVAFHAAPAHAPPLDRGRDGGGESRGQPAERGPS